MPFSSPQPDNYTKSIIETLSPKNVLDIGAGAGKYGNMIKSINRDIRCVAIEPVQKYIDGYKLETIYDEIIKIYANELIDNFPDRTYDLVIMGDVIEHIRKSDGIDLIEFLIQRSKHILLIFPLRYLQYTWEGIKEENHISIWKKDSFNQYDIIKDELIDDKQVVLIKGWL